MHRATTLSGVGGVVQQRSARGPVTAAERSPVPDVARGLALLGIAVANSSAHVHGVALGADGRPVDGSWLDHLVNGVVTLFVDRRTLPMFALLLGYGFVLVLRRQEAAGVPFPAARALLLRRCLWLAVFGVAHVLLLFLGDILFVYGLVGLALVALVRVGDRALLRWVWVLVALTAVGSAIAGVALGGLGGLGGAQDAPFPDETYLGDLAVRAITLASLVVAAPVLAVGILPAMLAGVWLARRRALEEPSAHRRLLRRLAVGGLAVSIAGGLPHALVVARLWRPPALTEGLVSGLHATTGLAGGVALAALVALAVGGGGGSGAPRGTGPVVRALRAVGSRSLTCYLAQSVLFVLPLAPWAGGLGVGMSSTQVVAWAVGVWLATVLLALALEAAGRPGPADALLRRLVYRGARTAVPAPA